MRSVRLVFQSRQARGLGSFILCGAVAFGVHSLGCGGRSAITCFDDRCLEDSVFPAGVGAGDPSLGAAGTGGGGATGSPEAEGGGPAVAGTERPELGGLAPLEPEPNGMEEGSSGQGGMDGETAVAPGVVRCELTSPAYFSTRAALEELRGCTHLVGDLLIGSSVFSGDLAPLQALAAVEGSLTVGRGVTSLQGLGSLVRAGALILEQSDVEDLSGLGEELALGGDGLLVADNPQLRSLRGVPALTTGVTVVVRDNPILSDGSALTLPERVASIQLVNNPRLASLSDLGARSVVWRVHVQGLALTDLSAFSRLQSASELIITDLASLSSLAGLESLESVGLLRMVRTGVEHFDALSSLSRVDNLIVEENPTLIHMDALTSLATLHQLAVSDNAVLTRLPTFSNVPTADSVVVRDNPSLEEAPALPRIRSLERLELVSNASLTEVLGFSEMTRLRRLRVDSNPRLQVLDLSALGSVELLVDVTCNQSLPFDSVAHLEDLEARRVDLSGNLGSLEPCTGSPQD